MHHIHIDKNLANNNSSNKKVGENNEDASSNNRDLLNQIFGEKGYEWLQSIFQALEHVRLDSLEGGVRMPSKQLVYKLKLCSILIDLLTSQMMKLDS